MTFTEGTRFTEEKHSKQNSPYKHLLTPKAGGLSFTISAMGNKLNKLLDVTIVYPEGILSGWDFLCGKLKKVEVHVEERIIPDKYFDADIGSDDFKKDFSTWLNEIWKEKDNKFEKMLGAHH